jgi:hypothetical protein
MSAGPGRTSATGVLAATVSAAAAALVILVVAVLPAEYGIDPLGTGALLGLTALSGAPDAGATVAPDSLSISSAALAPYAEDLYAVELRPFEGVEYKYRLEQGGNLVYTWEATDPVRYEFHGEPDGSPAGHFESYAKGEAAGASGGFTAARAGIHGWFWENPGATRITVTLRSAGFYSASTEYRDGDRNQRAFREATVSSPGATDAQGP